MANDTADIRPIDANAFKQQIAACTIGLNLDTGKSTALLSLVDKQPTISAVPQEGALETLPDKTPILHKCKFCGGKAGLYLSPDYSYPDSNTKNQGHYVACLACGCRTAAFKQPDNAIKAWNRVPEKA